MYYLNNRYYDPVIGRFINADTSDVLIVSPTSFTDKNLYAYRDNNPVMRVDSTGEFWNIAAGAIIGGAISAATQIAANVISGEKWSSGVLMATVAGAASGALASTGIGLTGQIFGNAGISAASEVASQLKDGNTDISSIAINAGIMAVVGGISGAIGGPGIRSKGTAYKKSIDTLNSVKGNVSKALSNPKGYRHQINSAIKNHASMSRTAVKSTAKSFTKASGFATFWGRVKNWFSR